MTAADIPTELLTSIGASVEALVPDLVQLRRQIHQHPELGFKEVRTTRLIEKHLREANIRLRTFDPTGLVAEVGAVQPNYRSALRADIDALPIPEYSGVPFSSEVADVCHACGHDVHTVVALGVALALKEHDAQLEELGVAVRIIFQPAEEIMPGGAHTVLEERAMEGVDRIFAVHCDPSKDVGTVGLKRGPITAACDSVHVRLEGSGGHTSRPHLTQDVVYALSKVVTDAPAVLSRRLDPRSGAALVWGQINAGFAPNVIPSTGEVHGTLRVLDASAWDASAALVEPIIREIVAPYGVKTHVKHVRGVPPVVNDRAAITALSAAATQLVGPKSVVPTTQSMGGEDFSWMLRETPGALARLGTRTPGGRTFELHQGDLVIDERAIGIGAKLLAGAALVRPSN